MENWNALARARRKNTSNFWTRDCRAWLAAVRIFVLATLLLKTPLSFAVGSCQVALTNRVADLKPRSLSVPSVRVQTEYQGLELPEWQASRFDSTYGLAQMGGFESSKFIVDEVSGESGVDVVGVSTERFKLAPGWGDLKEWLQERVEIAASPDYQNRSRYWVTRPVSERGKPINESKIETTYGMTWGEYTRFDIEGKTPAQIYGNTKIRLPEEKTLRKPVTRYLDSQGRGIAIEFRAVSKDPLTTPGWLRDEGLVQMIQGILEITKNYPELYDRPIVTCYADQGHRELYENWMKMRNQSETTPEDKPAYIHDKQGNEIKVFPWWYIEVSPKDLEEILMTRIKGGRRVEGHNQTFPFMLPNGQRVRAMPKAPIAFDSENHVTLATLAEQTELQSGIFADEGATAFWVDQNLVRVSKIAEPYAYVNGTLEVTAPKGATLEWNSPFLRAWLAGTAPEQVYYEPNVDMEPRRFQMTFEEWQTFEHKLRSIGHHRAAEKNSPQNIGPTPLDYQGYLAEMNREARQFRQEMGKPSVARIVSKIPIPIQIQNLSLRASQVEVSASSIVARITTDTEIENGIWAAANTDLEVESTPHGARWVRLALARDTTIKGNLFKKATVLVRYNNDIMAYTAFGKAKQFRL